MATNQIINNSGASDNSEEISPFGVIEHKTVKNDYQMIQNTLTGADNTPYVYIHSTYKNYKAANGGSNYTRFGSAHSKMVAAYAEEQNKSFERYKSAYHSRIVGASSMNDIDGLVKSADSQLDFFEIFSDDSSTGTANRKKLESALTTQLYEELAQTTTRAGRDYANGHSRLHILTEVIKEATAAAEDFKDDDFEKWVKGMLEVGGFLSSVTGDEPEKFLAELKKQGDYLKSHTKKVNKLSEIPLSDNLTVTINALAGKNSPAFGVNQEMLNSFSQVASAVYAGKISKAGGAANYHPVEGKTYSNDVLINHLGKYTGSQIFGEGIVAQVAAELQMSMLDGVSNNIKNFLDVARVTGRESGGTVSVEVATLGEGSENPTYTRKDKEIRLNTSKSDVVMGAIVTLKLEGDGGTVKLAVNLGLNLKTYSAAISGQYSANSGSISKLMNIEGQKVKVHTGQNIMTALSTLYGVSAAEEAFQYYVRNTFTRIPSEGYNGRNKDKKELASRYKDIKKALWREYGAVYLSGSAKESNFCHVIMINGVPYSIYDIMKAMTSYEGEGSQGSDIAWISLGAKQVTTKEDVAAFNTYNGYMAWRRNASLHNAMNGWKLEVHLKIKNEFIVESLK